MHLLLEQSSSRGSSCRYQSLGTGVTSMGAIWVVDAL